MNIVAVIQARMSSSRLPGKVMLDLAGKSVIEHVCIRLKKCKTISNIVIATSTDPSDDIIERWCTDHNVNYYRGSLNDVLDRYYQTAKVYHADAIVRITSDCPLIDPFIVDEVVENFIKGNYDFYGLSGNFPDGLDCTVFGFEAIRKAWKEASLPSEREHVGPYIENHPETFKNGGLIKFNNLSHYRWTLDEPKDYDFLKTIFSNLYINEKVFLSNEIIDFIEKNPSVMTINSNIIRNEGYLKSLQKDADKNV